MKVTKIYSINFLGKIIDAHAHIGHHEGRFYQKDDLDVFIKESLPNGDNIEKIIVSDIDILHATKNEYEGNKELIKTLCNDKKYALLASCSPKDGNIKQIEKLFKEHPYNFAGLKFHPTIQNLDTTRSEYKPYLEFAEINNLPCLFHTEVITDKNGKLVQQKSISDPEAIYNLAKNYKKTPFVLAHMGAGWNEAHDKAIDILVQSVKNGDANLYADISWVDIDAADINKTGFKPKEHVIKAIKALKGIGDSSWKYGDQSYRLMFGTDAPLARFKSSENKNAVKDYTKFIDEIKQAIKEDIDLKADAEKIIDDLFYNNAKKLYLDPITIKEAQDLKNILEETTKSSNHRFRLNFAAATLIVAAGAIYSLFDHNKASKQSK